MNRHYDDFAQMRADFIAMEEAGTTKLLRHNTDPLAELTPDPAQCTSATGFVISMRKLSKKLFFVNLVDRSISDKNNNETVYYLEIIVAAPRAGDVEGIATHRKCCTVTNEVQIDGYLERNAKNAIVLVASSIKIITSLDTEPDAVGNTRLVAKNSVVGQDLAHEKFLRRLLKIATSNIHQKIPLGAEHEVWLPPICKHWMKNYRKQGKTLPVEELQKFQNTLCQIQGCTNRHYCTDEESERFLALTQQQAGRLAMKIEDPVHTEDDKLAHSTRSSAFADFLEKTFGREYLNSGTGVVDIAGGVGAITFELHVKRNIRCTLIDPRKPKLIKYHVKYIRQKMKQERLAKQALAEADTTEFEMDMDIFDNDDSNTTVEDDSKPTSGLDTCVKEEMLITFPHREIFFSTEVAEEDEELRAASLFMGMHPDQATCPILDAALTLNKPFCIVPCCVFPSLFPDRRTSDNEPVTTYPQYIRYLTERDSRIKTAFLPFKGRNLVLYMTPEDVKAG